MLGTVCFGCNHSCSTTHSGDSILFLTLQLPWVIKTEFLFTISIQYHADKWWEWRKISFMGLLIDPTQLVWRHYLTRWQENLKAKRLSQERKRGFRWTAVVLANPASHIWEKKWIFHFHVGSLKWRIIIFLYYRAIVLLPPGYLQSVFNTNFKGFVLQRFSNKLNFEAFCRRAL